MNYRWPPALRGMARGVSDFGILAAFRGIGAWFFFARGVLFLRKAGASQL